jgi:hypothetical protein
VPGLESCASRRLGGGFLFPVSGGVAPMKSVIKGLALFCAVALVAPVIQAADVPSFNKRGTKEKEFVAKVTNTIVSAARTSIKSATVEKYQYKEPKAGRKDLHIMAAYKGAVTKKAYTADIVVHLDTSNSDKWEVLSIDYKDTSKNIIGPNRKNLTKLVTQFNNAR